MKAHRSSGRQSDAAVGPGSPPAAGAATIDRGTGSDPFHLLFEHSLEMLCVAGFDGRFKRLNRPWQQLLGWTLQELCGRPWLDFVHPEDRQATAAAADALFRGEPVHGFENRYLCRDGSYRVLSWSSVPLVDERSIFAVVRDVTGQRAADRALMESRQLQPVREQADRRREVLRGPAPPGPVPPDGGHAADQRAAAGGLTATPAAPGGQCVPGAAAGIHCTASAITWPAVPWLRISTHPSCPARSRKVPTDVSPPSGGAVR